MGGPEELPPFQLPDPPASFDPGPLAPERPVLPALARVILYMAAWLVLAILAELAGVLVYGIGVALNGGNVTAALNQAMGDHTPPAVLAITSYAGFVVTLLVTLFFVNVLDRRPLRSLGFERVNQPAHWGAGVLVEGLHFTLLFGIGLAAGWYRVIGVASLPEALIILLVSFAIAIPAAAVEEITMRGYVLQALESRYGTLAGVLGSSALFAALHLGNPNKGPLTIPGLVVAGVYLAIPYLATRRLWLPIAMHAAWNVFEGPVYGLPVSGLDIPKTIFHVQAGGPELWTGGKFGPEAGLLVLFTSALFGTLVWRLGPRLPGAAPALSDPLQSVSIR